MRLPLCQVQDGDSKNTIRPGKPTPGVLACTVYVDTLMHKTKLRRVQDQIKAVLDLFVIIRRLCLD